MTHTRTDWVNCQASALTRAKDGAAAAAGVLLQRVGEKILFSFSFFQVIHATNPERPSRLKGVYISKVSGCQTVVEINNKLISLRAN